MYMYVCLASNHTSTYVSNCETVVVYLVKFSLKMDSVSDNYLKEKKKKIPQETVSENIYRQNNNNKKNPHIPGLGSH